MNKLKDIISPGHRQVDDLLYSTKDPSPGRRASSTQSSLSHRGRSMKSNGSPRNSAEHGSAVTPPTAETSHSHESPADSTGEFVDRDNEFQSQPTQTPRQSDATEYQIGHVNSGRPTYLSPEQRVPSEIASVASIKSGTVGYPNVAEASNDSATLSPRRDDTITGGTAIDNDHDVPPQTIAPASSVNDSTTSTKAPIYAMAGAAAVGAGGAAYQHQKHSKETAYNDYSYEYNQGASDSPPTNAFYADNPTYTADSYANGERPTASTPAWERPSLMPGAYVSENDIRHNTGPEPSKTVSHKSKIANFLDPRVKHGRVNEKHHHEGPPATDSASHDYHGQDVALNTGVAGFAGAGESHETQPSHKDFYNEDYSRNYETQNSPYSAAPLDPRVDTATRGTRYDNAAMLPAGKQKREVSPVGAGLGTAETFAAYEARNHQMANTEISPSISPISDGEPISPEHYTSPSMTHSRYDSVQEDQQPYKAPNDMYTADVAETAGIGGAGISHHYSKREVEKADKRYRQEYKLYEKEVARDKAAEERELNREKKAHEKELAKEQKAMDKQLAKSQKAYAKEMRKEAKQIQKDIERQERMDGEAPKPEFSDSYTEQERVGDKDTKRRSRKGSLLGIFHHSPKDKHMQANTASQPDDLAQHDSSSMEAKRSYEISRNHTHGHERNRLAKSIPPGFYEEKLGNQRA